MDTQLHHYFADGLGEGLKREVLRLGSRGNLSVEDPARVDNLKGMHNMRAKAGRKTFIVPDAGFICKTAKRYVLAIEVVFSQDQDPLEKKADK